MKHCDRMPPRWNVRVEWPSRWHALFCAECRRASGADRKLRRGVGAFRRALDRAPLPSELEAQIQARLGLGRGDESVADRKRQGGDGRPTAVRARSVASRRSAAAGTMVVFTAFALLLARWSHGPAGVHHLRIANRAGAGSSSRERDSSESVNRFAAKARSGRKRERNGKSSLWKPGEHEYLVPESLASSSNPPDIAPSLSSRFRGKNDGAGRRDDLALLNGDALREDRRWAPLPHDAWEQIEARVRRNVQVRDDFVRISFPQLASTSDRQIAAAVESYKQQAAIVDPRLSREVTLQFKATALSDLCDRLRSSTGIHLSAGPSVADEKVTLFCEKVPLREVMRQLSRPFGYTWLRSKREGEYRYELVQDLRSQLLEEELRNRDRNAALIALDREMDQYRPYLSLSWAEVQARAKTAPPEQKQVLEDFSAGWGAAQMYFRLSPAGLTALRSGQKLTFSTAPAPGQQPMPPEQARVMLDSFRQMDSLKARAPAPSQESESLPESPASVPRQQIAEVTVWIRQSELGQFTFGGNFGVRSAPPAPGPMPRTFQPHVLQGIDPLTAGPKPGTFPPDLIQGYDPLAVGESPVLRSPNNAATNARLAGDPALRLRVTVHPQSSCRRDPAPSLRHPSPAWGGAEGEVRTEPKVTSADVLEALSHATGIPIVADFYTRLYEPGPVSVQNRPLFDALNQLADTLRMRWAKDRGWLEFRSASFYDDRLKEVPNRLLMRWADARRRQGMLSLDDVVEIAQLPDAQLDATAMAEGARECWGLAEWDLIRNQALRPHWRYLAGFPPARRQEAMSANGLAFTQMSLSQQQQFLAFIFGTQAKDQKVNLEELARAALQVNYTPQGWFQWAAGGSRPNPFDLPPVRERTLEAALQAARRIDPQAIVAQITPSEPSAAVYYLLGAPNHRYAANFIQVSPYGEMSGGP